MQSLGRGRRGNDNQNRPRKTGERRRCSSGGREGRAEAGLRRRPPLSGRRWVTLGRGHAVEGKQG